uniref:Uncharacterized protein n=1 Tax=Parascaris equorum TaxID=6256 RepID=A0A914RZZ0_PAREQ
MEFAVSATCLTTQDTKHRWQKRTRNRECQRGKMRKHKMFTTSWRSLVE